jgi:hypothetical protein
MPDPSPCEAALGRLSDLIAGALDEAEAAQLDRHLTECEACYRGAVAFFDQDRTFAQISSESRLTDAAARLRRELRAEAALRRRRLVVFGSLAAAALLAAVFFVVRSGSTPGMVLELAQGEVFLLDGSGSRAAGSGDAIRTGLGLETRGTGSRAVIRFGDRTTLELTGQTTVRDLRESDSHEGKRLVVTRGAVVAEVTPQPEGRPMILLSSSAEARVLGTTLRFTVDDDLAQSRLEVENGTVRLTRLLDRESIDVPSGHFAVAAGGVELALKPLKVKGAPADLLQMDYAPLRSLLQLKSKTWAALPWTATITDARETAAREKKPIFMIVGDGHPLGWVGQNAVSVREGVLSDPKVATLLKERFVLVAIDNTSSLPNLTAAERSWLQSFDSGFDASTMGFSVFTPEGRKLTKDARYEPRFVQEMLESALRVFRPAAEPVPPLDRQGVDSIGRPPAGGLTIHVTWKAFYDEPEAGTVKDARQVKLFQHALGSDRLWVRKDEVEALAQQKFPDSLKARVMQYYLNRIFVTGVKRWTLALEDGRIHGWAQTGAAPDEGISFQGFLDVKDGAIVRFELLARGTAVRPDEFGFMASLAVAPKGKRVPMALYFELAPPEALSRVTPRSARDPNYLR